MFLRFQHEDVSNRNFISFATAANPARACPVYYLLPNDRLEAPMRTFMLLIACLTVFAASSHAADDIAAAQTVIRSQERAFISDDAAAAYSYAGPPITSMYR